LIVKLHTTTSTNSYLKNWLNENTPENFMVVVADEQTEARGQRGTQWFSEKGKNLTFSMFVELRQFPLRRHFEINQAVSVGLFTAIKKYLPDLEIKWPNDILSDSKKIAGILIENTVSKKMVKHSIVGIGLNVNQTEFPATIPNASSLKILSDRFLDLDVLLQEIIDSIKEQFILLKNNMGKDLNHTYLKYLYLYNQETTFIDSKHREFVGKIIGLTESGRLQIAMRNSEIRDFGYKEISFFS